ncbi:2405_t:CDS:2, partial [Cetraspora pellucida]
ALNDENSNDHDYDYITNEHDYNYITNEQDNNYVTNEHDNDHVTNEHNDDHVTNEHNNDHEDSSIPKNGSSTNQAIKPNLKDLQLIPIDKIPGKRSMDSSTGNFIGHLVSRHGITEESYKQNLQQQQSKQTNINKDQLPINIREGAGFVEFLTEFDPSYHLPYERQCRKLLTDAFLSFKESLKEILSNNIITCSLTCDLWTGQNRMRYLGVTCSFINNNFQLVELVLTIKYLPYPHTGEMIAEALNFILDD